MSNDTKKSVPDEGGEKKLWSRVKSVLHLDNSPDTTEDLEQEIQELLEEGEEQGLISRQEEKLISSIFDFRDTVASQIMTPAAEMVCAEENTSVADLIALVTEEGYTRIPIYRGTQDDIIGILHAKDLLKICARGPDRDVDISKYLNPPYFIPESKPITDLLRFFQSKKSHVAIVTDEFDSVRGLVTLEDVIEEIVGEIDDEHDQDEKKIRVVDPRTIVVDARVDVEDVEEHFGIRLPEGPYESIGGLIIHRLGRVPARGAKVEIDTLQFLVLSADKRRIRTIRIRRR